MKKFYTFILGLMTTMMSFAQTDEAFAFVNANGEVIANGSTITVKNYEINDYGDILMPSGLSVKNVSDLGPEVSQSSMKVKISQMSNGALQHCFPSECVVYKEVGEYQGEKALLKAGSTKLVSSEWLPVAYGTCTVIYTLQRYSYDKDKKTYTFIADGPSVTVNYIYDEESVVAINEISTDVQKYKAVNLQGLPVTSQYKGIVIIDGKKVFVK